MSSKLNLVVSNPTNEKTSFLFYPEASYQVLHFRDNSISIWRIRPRYYPEQLYLDTWVSDFGFGDYDADVNYSVKIKEYSDYDNLPVEIRERTLLANKKEYEHQKILSRPSLKVVPKPLNWLQRLAKKLFRL